MPTYVYRCENGHEQINQHSMSYAGHFVCPMCGKSMARVPQAVNFSMKIMDAGQRNAKEINAHLEEKYRNNKERRESNEFEYRKGQENG